jgi:hypothetical protein
MSHACIGTPISWLRLERYHAGELPTAEHDDVAAHLRECIACAACLGEIVHDERALPPLPAARARPWYFQPRRVTVIASALALAAAIILFARPEPKPESDRWKGSDVTLTLVHENEGVVPEAGAVYGDGDRFKVLVTCPPGKRATWDVAVIEHTEVSFPFEPAADIACGNQIPLPGAFRLTGHERVTVCLVWSDGRAIDREEIRLHAPGLPTNARCQTLQPR